MKKSTKETLTGLFVILLAAGLIVFNRFKYPVHNFTFSLRVSLGSFTIGLAVVFISTFISKAKIGATKIIVLALLLALLQSVFIF